MTQAFKKTGANPILFLVPMTRLLSRDAGVLLIGYLSDGANMAGHHALAFLLVFLGGGIGSMLRHAVNQTSAAHFGMSFPWGTLLVNIAGSLSMGLLAGWFASRGEGGQMARLFLATGILGGFTTFSAFSLDAVLLWERGQAAAAGMYAAGSVAAAIAGVFAGIAIMRTLLAGL